MAFGFVGKAFKGIGKGLGKGLGAVGDVAKRAAPLTAFIPGVGPLAAAGIGAAGGLLGNLNDKDGFKGALGDTITGGLVGGLGNLGIRKLRGGGLGGLLGGGGGRGPMGGLLGGPGGGRKLDALDIAALLGGGAAAISAGKKQGEANKLLKEAAARNEADLQSRAQFKDALLQRLGQPASKADLGAAFADPTNPFATAAARPAPAALDARALLGPDQKGKQKPKAGFNRLAELLGRAA